MVVVPAGAAELAAELPADAALLAVLLPAHPVKTDAKSVKLAISAIAFLILISFFLPLIKIKYFQRIILFALFCT
jgi:hypothetical protein